MRLTSRSRSFAARAYREAVWSLDALPGERGEFPTEGLTDVPGIGESIATLIREFAASGRLALLDELRERVPAGVADLREVARLTERQAGQLAAAGIDGLGGLRRAVADGSIESVAGFGPAKRAWLARRLDAAAEPGVPLPVAQPVAVRLAAHTGAAVAGGVRRFADMVPAVVLAGDPPAAERLWTSAAVQPVMRTSGEVAVRTHHGIPVRLHQAPTSRLGTALVEATGPPEHVAALRRVAGGALPDAPVEAGVYGALGLPLPPPELRDGMPAAGLPDVVEVADLRGDLHLHTDLSRDGRMGLVELLGAAVRRGYHYVAVTDHAENLSVSGVSRERMLAQRRLVASLRADFPSLTVLHGAELNIGPDGSLDYDPEFLAGYDWAVASIHSHFDLDRQAQTARLLTAIRNPAVPCIGHLTGRRLGHRPGIDVDLGAVFAAAAAAGTALEVNGHMDRLDLPAAEVARALDAGCLLALNSDAHRIRELDNVANATMVARIGRARAGQVVNAWPADRFLGWLTARRAA